ncbi:PIR protein [Plasmodium vivax]|uniref:VIR protein n=1 Tax=Plasmodium vivax TaxID=5855 RepID=A0A565A4C7_PLAVI|nr:PIR protein [Plasmodium vivax]
MSYPNLHYYVDADKYGEAYKSLKNLPLYKYQEELHNFISKNKGTVLDSHCKYCEYNIGDKNDGGSELRKLCEGICNILQNFDDIKSISIGISEDKWCPYMNWWIYNYVLSIPNYNNYISNFYLALTFICQSPKNQLKKCKFENYSIDEINFNKKKILNEFTEIYDDIKNKIYYEKNLNVQAYCKHIKENFRYYNTVKVNCTNEISCAYFNELSNFKNKIRELSNLNNILDKCNYRKTPCENVSNIDDDVPCLKKKGNPFLLLILDDDPEGIVNILLNVLIIFVPILAIFLILFKFTPLGRTLTKSKREKMSTAHTQKKENIREYMDNYAAYVDSEMKKRMSLAYHAA